MRRAVARVLQFVPVPEEWQALAFDTCLALLAAPAEPVAIRAYAFTAAARLAAPYPELAAELLAVAEGVLEHHPFGGAARPGRRGSCRNFAS